MISSIDVMRFILAYPGQAVPLDDLRARIGDGAQVKISAMEHDGLLRKASTGFFDDLKPVYSLGPKGVDVLATFHIDTARHRFTRRMSWASLIISILALSLSGLALYLQYS